MTTRPSSPPQRYVALLRAINVGGHVVKMDVLRAEFSALRFTEVETFIASGNVLFTAPSADRAALEQTIEQRLEKTLGYEVGTFLRTPAELSTLVASLPFSERELDGCTLSIAFLKREPATAAAERVHLLCTDDDALLVRDRELFWRCRGRTSDSKVWRKPMETVIGMSGTFRNVTTVRKLAAKTAGVSR